MRRRASQNSADGLRVLLDTSYFLPVFGIEVRGFSPEDLLRLREHALASRLRIHYPDFMWIELLPKVYREAVRHGFAAVDTIVRRGVLAISQAVYLHPVGIDAEAVLEAWRLRSMGHEDMIDNLIYGVARSKNLVLVTMDQELRHLAEKLGEVRTMDHKELLDNLEAG